MSTILHNSSIGLYLNIGWRNESWWEVDTEKFSKMEIQELY